MRQFRAMAALVAGLFFASGASAVTIDFEGSPLTGPFGPPDWLSVVSPGECGGDDRARILDDEYASQGVVLSPVFPGLIGGALEPDGTPDPDDDSVLISWSALTECPSTIGGLAPLTITFSTGQSTATFDVFMNVEEAGESFPLDLLDSFGNSFSTMTLTPADAVIPVGITGGRFEVSSVVPFFGLKIGLTTTALGPGTGGVFFDNLFAASANQLLSGKKLLIANPTSGPANNKVVFLSKDPIIATPIPVDADPRCIADGGSGAGGVLVVNSATTGEGFSISLPCGNWELLSSGAYKYKDTSGTTCKMAMVKAGKLVKAVCKGTQVLYDLGADQVSVDVELRTGTTPWQYCSSFNATTEGCDVKKNGSDNEKYLAKNCTSGPAACFTTVTSTTVTTTTTTSSTTSTTSSTTSTTTSTTTSSTTTSSTTSTTTSTTTSSTTSTTICFQDLGDGTILDTCTGLQWEKKTTAVGSGANAADLHDVDNGYRWAGNCSGMLSKLCQPNLAAETACKAQTDVAYWTSGCEQCVGGEGTCTVTPITTVWDWLVQVNAANYAGHNDWRLPSESGCNSCFASGSCASCSAHELETILVSPFPCGTSPCIDSIFGPTVQGTYRSSSTSASSPTHVWGVHFNFGEVHESHKLNPVFVRAVRGGS